MSDAAPKTQASPDTQDLYEHARNALVSSLCELSTAATQTASAALNFYKLAAVGGSDAAHASTSLQTLSDSVLAVARKASTTLANGTTDARKTPVKPLTKKDAPAPVAANSTPASVAAKATAAEFVPTKAVAAASSSQENGTDAAEEKNDSKTDVYDPLATTDPALVNVGATAPAAPEEPEKAKKKRVKKDPNAPKKPVTSYLRFNLAVREELRKERNENRQPTLQATELNQIIADRWSTLGEAEKLKLQKAYESEYEAYKKAFDEYKVKKQAADAPAQPEPAPVVIEEVPSEPAEIPPSSRTEKPKKKKKALKMTAEIADVDSLETVEAVAAAATEAAQAAIAAEVAQSLPRKSKKRKDKDSSEKLAKKKKTEVHA